MFTWFVSIWNCGMHTNNENKKFISLCGRILPDIHIFKKYLLITCQFPDIVLETGDTALDQKFSTWAHWHFDKYFFVRETVLYIVGCLVAFLSSTHKMPAATPLPSVTTTNVSRHYQMSPGEGQQNQPGWDPLASSLLSWSLHVIGLKKKRKRDK